MTRVGARSSSSSPTADTPQALTPLAVAGLLRREGVAAIVIDCEAGPIRLGLAATLANALGAVCLRPEELSANGLAGVVRSHREAA